MATTVSAPVPESSQQPSPERAKGPRGRGLKVERRATREGQTALEVLGEVEWTRRAAKISGADGEVVFKMDDAEVPADWSQLATDVAVSKYFRKAGVPTKSGAEESVRQIVTRVAHTLRVSGEEQGGYFATPKDAETFEAELSYYLVHQIGAFNSPVWFNCGLKHQYGIAGSGGNWAVDLATGQASVTADAYSRPQVSACFIQSCGDDLDSIFNLIHDEARVFKYGSGSGTNFSKVRGKTERLSGGGTSSGLLSFLEVLDRAAGATKSGGITRRAAKMVVLDADHPEIRDFIGWKAREEKKVAALIAGGYPSDFNGEAYRTVSGQNANNSVRITDKFMEAVEKDAAWETTARTTGEVVEKMGARELWNEIAEAAWKCADPGLQYDDTINRWHTCKATDRIYASNPCSEFVFLDDTACNLASLNLLKFLDEKTGQFDVDGYKHACRIFFLAQEIAVDLASYPTKRIAERSFAFRPLGLGYANLGTLLMVQGIPYDSDAGRATAGAITAVMTGEAYSLSAEMAQTKGPFQGYAPNRESMLGVMRMHQEAVHAIAPAHVQADLLAAAHDAWARAVKLGEEHGYRNAQSTVLAPTGTIGLLMDCDTTGVEPDFALIKFKKLSGGGSFKIVNQSVPRALKKMGYAPAEVQAIVDYVRGTATLKTTPDFQPAELLARGLTEAEIGKVEKSLESVFDLRASFAPHILGPACLARLGLAPLSKGAAVLEKLGYTQAQIDAASLVVCGRQTVEGAPYLKAEHYPVFDCANRCGPLGTRYIEPMGHVRMMAAAQPFLAGAISKTINMPPDATAADVERVHTESWRLGLKAIAIYRDGSKLSQPLSAGDRGKKDGKAEPLLPMPVPTEAKALSAALSSMLQLTPDQAERMAEACFNKAAPQGQQPSAAPAALTASMRRRLPSKRHGLTQEAKVGGNKIFLRTGEYEDGALGEIFIDMHKEGAALRSVMNCFAMLVSIALQYGVPLDVLVEQFVFTRFEPQGPVQGHDRVKFATSVIDYIFRALGIEYLGRDDLAHVTPEAAATTPTANMGAEPGVHHQPTLPSSPATVAKAAQKNASAPTSNGSSPPPARRAAAAQDQLFGQLSGDAPFCDVCGHITLRNGTCYKCLNCGNSMGCS